MHISKRTPWRLLLMALTIAALASSSITSARTEERKWIALDEKAEPGSKAVITVNREKSDSSQTLIEGRIPGYWIVTKYSPDGEEFQQFVIPGMGSHNQLGAPDLPKYNFKLATPQIIDGAYIKFDIQDKTGLDKVRVWPQPIPEMDGEKEGTPEQFKMDKKIYSSQRDWPSAPAPEKVAVGTALRDIPSVSASFSPMQWNPASGELKIYNKFQIYVSHKGKSVDYPEMSQERYKLAERVFLNWKVIKEFRPNFVFYKASYLFVYPDKYYRDELLPLIQQKKARGFKVTELTVDGDIGSRSCAAIREAIAEWEAKVPFFHDAYALLVGDTNVIPHCTSPTGDQTDDLYATTDGDDLDEEIYLGRLSVDNEGDLAFQVQKILTYEDSPSMFCCYDRAVLWAHKENAPGKYVGAHETVRTNSYSNPPIFRTRYGHLAGVNDTDIRNDVNRGIGLLAYRGHGSKSATATGWDLSNNYFNSADVSTLANYLSRSPVVWSFACTNAKLDESDSIAERWMENQEGGAVSYYGATRTSYTSANHVLDEWMFQAVYNEGLVTQSHAIQRGEEQMDALDSWGDNNAWMYLLLGDPDMQIRTDNPLRIIIKIPELIRICKFCDLKIAVVNELGRPVENALVGLYKEGSRGIEEVAINGYTSAEGEVALSYSALTSGEMLVSVEDGKGNALLQKVPVGYMK